MSGRSLRDPSSSSSPSRNTMQRNPSHFGSNSSPASCGTSCTALASIGFTGGITGRSTGSTVLSVAPASEPELRRAPVGMASSPGRLQPSSSPADHGRRRHPGRGRGPGRAGVAGVGGQAAGRGRRRLAVVPGQDRRGRRRAARDGARVAAHQVRGGVGRAALAGRVRRAGPSGIEAGVVSRRSATSTSPPTSSWWASTWPAPPSWPTAPPSRRSGSSSRCCAATSRGASSSASRAPAPTSRRWAPAPSATATSG